jgi:hypothetical protein
MQSFRSASEAIGLSSRRLAIGYALLSGRDIRLDHFGRINDTIELVFCHKVEFECGILQRESWSIAQCAIFEALS